MTLRGLRFKRHATYARAGRAVGSLDPALPFTSTARPGVLPGWIISRKAGSFSEPTKQLE
jgi:hypothetical protein